MEAVHGVQADPAESGAAIVQAMVFGNYDFRRSTGSKFTVAAFRVFSRPEL